MVERDQDWRSWPKHYLNNLKNWENILFLMSVQSLTVTYWLFIISYFSTIHQVQQPPGGKHFVPFVTAY